MERISVEALMGKVGEEIGVSEWVTVDQAMIDRFADATGDHQFLHVDPEAARETPYGGTIAHGFLTLALFPMFASKGGMPEVEGVKMGVNYGGNRVRFLAPVRSGSRMRGRFRLLSLEEKRPGQYQQVIEYTGEVEGQEKPAVVAEWVAQFFV